MDANELLDRIRQARDSARENWDNAKRDLDEATLAALDAADPTKADLAHPSPGALQGTAFASAAMVTAWGTVFRALDRIVDPPPGPGTT